jgi:ABC-2 type transport system ATP-binding protein
MAAAQAGLELSPVSLQQLIVRKTNSSETEFEQSA